MAAPKEDNPHAELDRKVALKLRAQLEKYQAELRTDISEMAEGLQIARPTMHKFMRASEESIEFPPISRSKVYCLWEALTSPEKIDPAQCTRRYRRNAEDPEDRSTEEIRAVAIKKRKLLKEQGPDELLIAAGFIPQQMKWIGVSPDRYPQMIQMALLLDNDLLSFDAFMKVTQTQLEEIIKATGQEAVNQNVVKPSAAISGGLEAPDQSTESLLPNQAISNRINANPTISLDTREKLNRRFNKAYDRICSESHRQRLSIEEALGLFSTILANELNRSERFNLKFEILNLEFKSLSLDFTSGKSFSTVREALQKVAIEAEEELNTTASSSKSLTEQFIPPVVQATITCSYAPQSSLEDVSENNSKEADEHRETIVFIYIACGTILNIATKAVALHLGFKESIHAPEIATKKFGNKMTSLVKCTSTLKCSDENDEHVQGDWVDRDFLKTYLQSLLIAAEKWILFQIKDPKKMLSRERYLNLFREMSILEKNLYEERETFHSYQFSDDLNDSNISSSLERISQEAQSLLDENLLNRNRRYLSTFSANLSRIYLLAKIHKLRFVNMQGNLSEAKKLISDINLCLREPEVRKRLLPLNILFDAEEKLYELSAGVESPLFMHNLDFWEDWLDRSKHDIQNYLYGGSSEPTIKSNYPSDPDIDVYQCLGTTYTIAGRWLFYLGDTTLVLEKASEYFMRAVHYFSRIGLGQRVARCLALAGRANVRTGNYAYADQLRKFAKDQVRTYLHDGHRDAFKQAALSEIHLLDGEYELHANSNYNRGLEASLRGLKGAMWLGLARRTSDNLYNIWQCSRHMGDQRVETLLQAVFPVLWDSEVFTTILDKKKRLNPLGNSISAEVIDVLFNIRKDADKNWSHQADRFQLMSSNVWNKWYREASDDALGKHPIGKKIDGGFFLAPCQS